MHALWINKMPDNAVKIGSINCNNQAAYRDFTDFCSVDGRFCFNFFFLIISLNRRDRHFKSSWKVLDALPIKIEKRSKVSDTLTCDRGLCCIRTESDPRVGYQPTLECLSRNGHDILLDFCCV